jgi:hypothetical protein
MDKSKLTNQIVKAAFDALQKGDKQAWADLFATGAGFHDDGSKRDIAVFNKNSVGNERFTSIDKVESSGVILKPISNSR